MANEFNIKNGFKSNGNSTVSGRLITQKLTITSGATNGYVLTSDASGNSVWQPSTIDTNIYNTDGTLNGNRVITMNGNTILFDGTNSDIKYTPNSVGGYLLLEGKASGVPRLGISVPSYLTKPTAGFQLGVRAWDDLTFTGYGKVGDAFFYAGNETYGFNLMNPPGTNTEDYIRFYAGINATSTSDVHIQGSGATRGYVGFGTESPTSKVDVIGKTRTTKLQVTSGATSGYVLTSDASGNATWVAPVALTYFSEVQNTTAPNATVPVDSLTAVSVATDTDFAILPKGAGAILADIPDGTVAGGNKRGQYAVDLQMARLTNASVASGNYSVISGGYHNTASNTQSTVGGGYQNTASGPQSTIGGGQQNGASSDFSTVGGGANNTASGSRTTVGGGASNTATAYAASTLGGFGNVSTGNYSSNLGGLSNSSTGDNSTVLGGASNSASGSYSICGGANSVANSIYGVALGGGSTTNSVMYRQTYGVRHTVNGDAQSSTFIMRMRTTDDTLTVFTSDGTSAASNNQVILPNQSAFRFKGTIIAKQSGSVNSAAWDIDGFIVRGANAASTTLNISNVTVIQNTPGWSTPTLAADTTQGGLRIQIQGAITTNIQWVADIKTTEVIYA